MHRDYHITYIYIHNILPVFSNIPICSTCVPTPMATQTRSGNAMPARIAAKTRSGMPMPARIATETRSGIAMPARIAVKNRSGQEIEKESKDNERDLDENWKVVEIAKELRENRKRMEDVETESERTERE